MIGGRFVQEPAVGTCLAELVDFDPELVIVSPGYRPDHVILEWAVERGVPVWGDIELAWRLRDKVALGRLGARHRHERQDDHHAADRAPAAGGGPRAAAVGNIGVPVLDADPRAGWIRRAGGRALQLPAALGATPAAQERSIRSPAPA